MSDLKKVASNTTYYTISTIVLRASSLIFFPIFSLYLTKSDYGTFSVVQSLVLIVGLLGGLGLNRALTRFIYYNTENNKSDHDSIIFTTLISNLIGQLFFSLLILSIGPYFLKPILKNIPFYPFVLIGLVTIFFNSFIDTARVYFKSIHEGKKAFILDMSFFSLNIIFNLIFVVGFGFDVLGLFLGILINTILFSIILCFTFYSKFVFQFKRNVWKGMVKYSIPLLPFTFLNVIFESIDKFFLNANTGSSDSGIYYLALTLAAVFSSFKESAVSAITPWAFENINSNISRISSVFNLLLLLTGILGFLISLFSQELLIVLSSNTDFIVAYKYVPFAVISFYVIFLGQLFNIKTFYYGNYHKFLFLATALGILGEIVCCYFLIPAFGISGAIFSRTIAFSLQTILLVYFSKKERENPKMYNYQFLFLCLIIMSSLISIPYFVDFSFSFTLNLIIKLLLLIVVVLVIYLAFKKEIYRSLSLLNGRYSYIDKWLSRKDF